MSRAIAQAPQTPVVTKACLVSPRVPMNVVATAEQVRDCLAHQERVKERLRQVTAALGWHASYTHRQK